MDGEVRLKPNTGMSNGDWRQLILVVPFGITGLCLLGTLISKGDKAWILGAATFASISALTLVSCLLWSIRDRLVEIRDRLPAPPPVPSAKT